jgi:hypothetical protein
MSAFPLIEVSGTPRARGRAYGEAARQRVRASAHLYADRLAGLGIADPGPLIEAFVPRIAAFDAAHLEEMEGIAEGAGLKLNDIVLINARTEIVAMAHKREEIVDGCTGVVVLPERSAGGHLIHAQNWDWLKDCAETGVVLKVARDDGPSFLTFTEAGGLARSGLNVAGIAITANYLESDRDYRQAGIPLPLIRRRVLEQQHFALAIKAVATLPKACSNNMMLSWSEGFAVDFECAPDEAFAIYPDHGLLVHASHWQSPVALAKLRETGLHDVPDSIYRDWRVRRLLDAAGHKLTVADVKAALADDFGTPYAVCRPPIADTGDRLSATVATLVMTPATGTMEVAPLPALGTKFDRYVLTDRCDDLG